MAPGRGGGDDSPVTTIVFVPGYGDSPPGHWQREWHDALVGEGGSPVWVTQPDWEAGPAQTWVDTLDAAVAATPGPLAVVAHSLGVLTVVRWAANAPRRVTARVAGALLVAAPDPAAPAFPAHLGWGAAERDALPFPALLVASSDDHYATPARSREFADAWAARLVDVGAAGHVNAASGFGPWPRGPRLLEELLS